jgi:hypothetical protein
MRSDFAGLTTFLAVDARRGPRAEGGEARTWPDSLVVRDNLLSASGRSRLVVRRGRFGFADEDLSPLFPANARAGSSGHGEARHLPDGAGPYAARRFSGHTRLGTGSVAHEFRSAGALG